MKLFGSLLIWALVYFSPHALSAQVRLPIAPSAAPMGSTQSAGTWTTGAQGTLGHVVYAAQASPYVIDLATEGQYDHVNWMVILDYESLTVQAGATIKFLNHPKRAPVVIRAIGDITINGAILLDGGTGHSSGAPVTYAEPGPGGYRGGRGTLENGPGRSGGFGPGGGLLNAAGAGAPASHNSPGAGGYAAGTGPIYGSPLSIPLVGGSGGSPSTSASSSGYSGGGGGGGAILIGSNTQVTIGGGISARGGGVQVNRSSGCGSGGTIRIVAPKVTQTGGTLSVKGGATTWAGGFDNRGGDGLVRIEVDGPFNVTLNGAILPDPPSVVPQLGEFIPQNAPRIALVSYWNPDAGQGGGWETITQDPQGSLLFPFQADVHLSQQGQTIFRIEGTNVPINSRLHVRTTRARGAATIDSAHVMGESGGTLPTLWTDVSISLEGGVTAIQVRAEL